MGQWGWVIVLGGSKRKEESRVLVIIIHSITMLVYVLFRFRVRPTRVVELRVGGSDSRV